MINNLSVKIADKLISKGAIAKNEYELYTYGLFLLISHSVFLALVFVFGLVFGCLIENIVFYAAFQFARRYAGGYHAATETKCEIVSALSLLACSAIIKLSKLYDIQLYIVSITLICAIVIFVLCPLDTPEKPLNNNEFKRFRLISQLILLVILALIAVAYYFDLRFMLVPLCMSLILEGILLAAGNKFKQKVLS